MQISAADPGPAQMVGNPGRLKTAGEIAQAREVLQVERVSRAERHRNAVQHDGIPLANLLEHLQWPAAPHHKVLGDHLEPVDSRIRLENVRVMRPSQPDSETQEWKV